MGTYFTVSYNDKSQSPTIFRYFLNADNTYDYDVTYDETLVTGYESWTHIDIENIHISMGLQNSNCRTFIHWVGTCKGNVVCDSKKTYKGLYFQDINDALKFRLIF